jgi:hypothetical protein
LIRSGAYRTSDGETKARMLKIFADRTNDMANERAPDLDRLDPDLIFEWVRKTRRSAERRTERDRERLFYAPE